MKHNTTAYRFGALALVSGMLGCGASMQAPASVGASGGMASSEAAYSGATATGASSGGGGADYAVSAAPSAAPASAGAASSVSRGAVAADSASGGGAPPPQAVAASPGSAVVAAQGTTTVAAEQPQPAAGVLTAASVGDADRRGNYLEYLARHEGEREALTLDMTRRVRIRVVDGQQRPVHNARVTISDGQRGEVASGRTHADGYWDFFPSLSPARPTGHLAARVQYGGTGAAVTLDAPARGDGQDVVVALPQAQAAAPRALELGFAIDVTGSMGDELRYVNREIASIVQRVRAASPNLVVRVGAVFYRDRTDAVPLHALPFTEDVPGFARSMLAIGASGGGDYPEDMNRGLELAMRGLSWSGDERTDRIMVVIADAPPQMYGDARFTYHHAIRHASEAGIRILPVAASGANRTVEYLFRAMGAATSTPYVYLTDESGVGGPHLEADTDRVAVERFNDLLVRLIVSDLRGEGMHEPGALGASGAQG